MGTDTDGSYIKASMLPDLDLYVDQITTFLTRHLAKTIRFEDDKIMTKTCLLYTSPSPRDGLLSRMPSSA